MKNLTTVFITGCIVGMILLPRTLSDMILPHNDLEIPNNTEDIRESYIDSEIVLKENTTSVDIETQLNTTIIK